MPIFHIVKRGERSETAEWSGGVDGDVGDERIKTDKQKSTHAHHPHALFGKRRGFKI